MTTNVKQEINCSLDPIPHRAAPYEELFFWGTRHHCPMKVGRCIGATAGQADGRTEGRSRRIM